MSSGALFAIVVAGFTATALWALMVQIQSTRALRNRLRSRIAHDDALRDLIDAIVDGDSRSGDALGALTPLGQAVVLARLATGIEGQELEHLRDIAGEAGAVERARNHLTHRRWWERLSSVSLLAALSVRDPVQLSLLDDPHPAVRAAAVRWVSRTGLAPEAGPNLLPLLADSDGLVQAATRDALANAGAAAAPMLGEALSPSSDHRVVRAALEVTAVSPDVDLLGTARWWVTSDRPELRAAVAGLVARSTHQEELRALLDDREADVRLAATRAAGRTQLATLGGSVGLRLGDEDWRVRDAAITALHQLGSPGQIVLRREAGRLRETTSS